MRRTVPVLCSATSTKYQVEIGAGSLSSCGKWARRTLGRGTARIAVISDKNVSSLYGSGVVDTLIAAGFVAEPHVITGGERRKDLASVSSVLEFLSGSGITRSDAVLALGGGVVGDIAGFAASIHLRGVPFLNIPTTLLAMIDASVGGKTGVNSRFGKNLIGAFHNPAGVMADPTVLSTLPRRELTAGFCEAIKQSATGGKKLFDITRQFLSSYPVNARTTLEPRSMASITDLISEHVAYKAAIVAGDERESAGRRDASSRKVLNFGHTLAHALEKVTAYRYFKHGEAVGHGILFAAYVSKNLALCPEKDVELLNDVVHRAGDLPSLTNIDEKEVLEAFRFDKKNTAGSLQMVLIKGIGKPVIVPFTDIPPTAIRMAFRELLSQTA